MIILTSFILFHISISLSAILFFQNQIVLYTIIDDFYFNDKKHHRTFNLNSSSRKVNYAFFFNNPRLDSL